MAAANFLGENVLSSLDLAESLGDGRARRRGVHGVELRRTGSLPLGETMNPTSDSADERLLALERRCARLRIWCFALTSIALVACVSSAVRPNPETVEARSFIVRDAQGAIRARLGVEHGGSRLSLFSKDQQGFAELAAWDRAPDAPTSGASLYMEADGEGADQLLALLGGGVSGVRIASRDHSIETFAREDGAGMRVFTERPKPEGQQADEKPFPDDAAVGNPSLRLEIGEEKASLEGFDASGAPLNLVVGGK
jgi:hypothetical protein